jgi:sugar phosphate isomerase/epimerase
VLAWSSQFDPPPAILFDVHHASLEEASVHAAMIRGWSSIAYLQISDSNRLPPGLGHYPFAETVRILAALGYDGYLSIECRQEPDSVAAARRAAHYLAPLLAEVGG